MIIRGNAWVFNFVWCITEMFNGDFSYWQLWLDIFSLVSFLDIINFSAVFRYGISRQST